MGVQLESGCFRAVFVAGLSGLHTALEKAPDDLGQQQRGLHQTTGGKTTSQATEEFGCVLVVTKPPKIG